MITFTIIKNALSIKTSLGVKRKGNETMRIYSGYIDTKIEGMRAKDAFVIL